MRVLLCVCALGLSVTVGTPATAPSSSQLPVKFIITIKTPESASPLAPTAYKSVHVQDMVPSGTARWNIVAIEPFIQRSNRTVRQLTVHICQWPNSGYHQKSVWYDDETSCQGAPSMLIYHWAPPSLLAPFHIADDLGFQVDKFKSVVLSVTYTQEQYVHKEQPGVILDVSRLIPRFHLGALTVGNQQHGTRFSCRLPGATRLLYTIKPLLSAKNHGWWRIYVIRNRTFGRKIVQPVLDSTIFANQNKTDAEILSSDIFLVSGDYILVECELHHESVCKFLILYAYKNLAHKSSSGNVYSCEANDHPHLFKLLPARTLSKTSTAHPLMSDTDSSSMFQFVCWMLVVIWISTIVGCVIMRRIRGLVNYRPEPLSNTGIQSTRPRFIYLTRSDQNKLTAEGDTTAQLDIEHMGLMS